MAVIRPPMPSASYTMIRNCWLRDARISYKAKGLLAYLCSHAEGYRISQNQMIRETRDGRDAVLSGLVELEGAGYLRRTVRSHPQDRNRRGSGQFSEDDYELSDPFDSRGELSGRPTDNMPDRSGGPTSSENPSGQTPAGSPEHKKIKGEDPSPPERGARHLAVAGETTQAQRQQQLTDESKLLTTEHYEAAGGMANYLAVLGVVKRALNVSADPGGHVASGSPRRYTPDGVRQALARLRTAGRPITLQTMHGELEQRSTPRSTARPYRDPSPDAYATEL